MFKKVSVTLLTVSLASTILVSPSINNVAAAPNSNVEFQLEKDYSSLVQTDKDIDKYMGVIEEYKNLNPEATVDEMNDMLTKVMDNDLKERLKKGSKEGPQRVAYIESKLNSKEKEVFNSNKYYGIQVLAAGKTALEESKRLYTNAALVDGNGDAFRHMLWNALGASYTSKSYMEKFATAHETGDPNNTKLRKEMDLYNNSKGRSISLNPRANKYYHSSVIMKKIDAGVGKRISGNKLVKTDSSGKK